MLLNLDAGEHDDEPQELWALADILAVACGGHAGDAASMARLCAFIASSPRRTGLGAHPSYPDRANFGRKSIAIEPAQLRDAVAEQCRALAAIARDHGLAVRYVKPHGALYHDANRDRALADAIIEGALAALRYDVDGALAGAGDVAMRSDAFDGALVGTAIDDGHLDGHLDDDLGSDAPTASREPLVIIGPPTGALADAARAHGLAYLREGFADRATRPDGSLVPRSEPGAMITDPVAAAARARELIGQVDTVCVHADSPGSLQIANAVRTMLGRSG